MSTQQAIEFAWLLTPALVASVASYAAIRRVTNPWAHPLASPTLAVAALLGMIVGVGRTLWPVADYTDWFAVAVLVAGVGGLLADLPKRLWMSIAVAFVATAVAVALPLHPKPAWSWPHLVGVSAGVGVVATGVGWLAMKLDDRERTPLVPLTLAGATLGAGLLTQLSGSKLSGDLMLPCAAAVAGLVALSPRTFGPWCAATAILAGGLAMASSWGTGLRVAYVVAVASAVPLAWAVALPGVRRLKPWQRAIVGLLVAATPTLVAVAVAYRQFVVDYETTGGDDYYGY